MTVISTYGSSGNLLLCDSQRRRQRICFTNFTKTSKLTRNSIENLADDFVDRKIPSKPIVLGGGNPLSTATNIATTRTRFEYDVLHRCCKLGKIRDNIFRVSLLFKYVTVWSRIQATWFSANNHCIVTADRVRMRQPVSRLNKSQEEITNPIDRLFIPIISNLSLLIHRFCSRSQENRGTWRSFQFRRMLLPQ
jgi:organic radical activating enzyme